MPRRDGGTVLVLQRAAHDMLHPDSYELLGDK